MQMRHSKKYMGTPRIMNYKQHKPHTIERRRTYEAEMAVACFAGGTLNLLRYHNRVCCI